GRRDSRAGILPDERRLPRSAGLLFRGAAGGRGIPRRAGEHPAALPAPEMHEAPARCGRRAAARERGLIRGGAAGGSDVDPPSAERDGGNRHRCVQGWCGRFRLSCLVACAMTMITILGTGPTTTLGSLEDQTSYSYRNRS